MPAANEVSIRITADDQGSKALLNTIQQLETLEKSVKDTSTSFRNIDRTSGALDDTLKDVVRTTRTYRDATGRLRDEMGRFARSTDRAQDSMAAYATSLQHAAGELRALRDFGARQLRGLIQAGAGLEQLESSFTSLLGSVDEARNAIALLRTAAQDPGLTFDVAARGARRFTSLGISIEESIHLMRGLANAAALSGTSLDQLDEGARQLFQAIARGKLEQEDLNSLTERFGTIARQIRVTYGNTAEEINKALKSQGLSIRDFARAITDLNNAPRASTDTLANQLSNLQNAITNLRNEIARELLPTFKSWVRFLTDIVNWFTRLDERQQRMLIDIGLFATAMGVAGTAAASLAANLVLLTTALGTNASGLVAGTIAGAGGLTFLGVSLTGLAAAVGGAVSAFLGLVGLVEEAQEFVKLAEAANSTIEVIGRVGEESDKTTDFVIDLDKAVEAAGGTFEDFEKAVVDADNAVIEFTKPKQVPQAPRATAPPPSPTRPVQPSTRGPADIPIISTVPTPAQIAENARIQRQAQQSLFEQSVRASLGIRNVWRGTFGQITATAQATENALTAITTDVVGNFAAQQQAFLGRIRLQNRDTVELATRQFQALGDLASLRFEDAGDDIRNLTDDQAAFTDAVLASAQALNRVADAFAALRDEGEGTLDQLLSLLNKLAIIAAAAANAIGGIQQVRGGAGGGGGQSGTDRALGVIAGIANIASAFVGLGRIFHNPSNDRIARIAAARTAGTGLPIGTVRAIQRQNATDFSNAFAEGVAQSAPREIPAQGQELVLAVQVNDITTQEIATRLTVMQQGGRVVLP